MPITIAFPPNGVSKAAIDATLTQYFYKPGLTGGQTGIGGINAGDNLVFDSTSNATKGIIQFRSRVEAALNSGGPFASLSQLYSRSVTIPTAGNDRYAIVGYNEIAPTQGISASDLIGVVGAAIWSASFGLSSGANNLGLIGVQNTAQMSGSGISTVVEYAIGNLNEVDNSSTEVTRTITNAYANLARVTAGTSGSITNAALYYGTAFPPITANNQKRFGIRIPALPDAGSFTGSSLAQIALLGISGIATISGQTGMVGNIPWYVPIDNGSAGKVLATDGNGNLHWQNPLTGMGEGVDLYLDDTASDIATYFSLLSTPTGGVEIDDSAAVTSATSPVLIEAYASGSGGLNRTQIDAGTWIFSTWAFTSNAGGTNTIRMQVYKRTALNVETLLFTVDTPSLSTSLTLYNVETVQPAYSINLTDRLVVKYYAVTTQATSRTIHFTHNGTLHYSHIHTPLTQQHNDLSGLQGGNSTERYHLTAAENQIATQAAGASLNGYLSTDVFNKFNRFSKSATIENINLWDNNFIPLFKVGTTCVIESFLGEIAGNGASLGLTMNLRRHAFGSLNTDGTTIISSNFLVQPGGATTSSFSLSILNPYDTVAFTTGSTAMAGGTSLLSVFLTANLRTVT